MNKFTFFSRSIPDFDTLESVVKPQLPRVVEIKGQVSSDDMFAMMERQLTEGHYENVTFESVGMSKTNCY